MRRISVIMLTIASVLTIVACVSNQAPTTGAPKGGKPLVDRLPASIKGVELVGGAVKAKSGYKFVQQPNGSVTVAMMAGGPALGGSWSCNCNPNATTPNKPASGKCATQTTGTTLTCTTGTCTGSCELSVTTRAGLTHIMAW